MNETANATLALGALPVMAHAREEVEEMVRLAGALVLNIGTLSPHWVEAMLAAGAVAGTGGRSSAITGCFRAAKKGDPLGAAAEALAAFGVAGEDAAVDAKGPGSFHVNLYDALAALDPSTMDARAKISDV